LAIFRKKDRISSACGLQSKHRVGKLPRGLLQRLLLHSLVRDERVGLTRS